MRSFSIGPDIYEQRVRRNLTDSVSDFLRQKEDLDPARLITAAQQHAREQAPKPTAELLAHQLKVQQSPWINEHHLLRIDDAGEHLLGTVGPLVATVVDTRANLWIPEEKELEEIFDLLWQAHADGRIEPGDETRLAFLAIALCMRDPSLARRAQQATGNKDRGFTLFSAFIDQHMAKEPLTSVPSR